MPDQKPNILFLFTDMQRHDTLGALGNPVIATPNLDRLVQQGTSFTSAYTPSPVCVAARCSLHYGRYPARTGCADNGAMPEDKGASWPALLAGAGYHTASVGKCHFTPDSGALRGFHERVTQEEGVPVGGQDDYRQYLESLGLNPREPFGMRGEMYYMPQPSHLPAAHHGTRFVASESLSYINRRREQGGPWALFASFIHPHPPFSPPIPWHKRYRTPDMPLPILPPAPDALHTAINKIQNRYKYRDRGFDLNVVRTIKAYYYACISYVDDQIGRLLKDLEDRGEIDNTLVVFSSDHGELLGDFGCFGKRSMHDGSSRIPLVLRHPKLFPAGRVCQTPVSLVDLLPTLARASGAPFEPQAVDGLPLQTLLGQDTDRTVFSQWSSAVSGHYMALNRRHKYFYSAADDREFLFDRIHDPFETQNRAEMASLKPIKEKLRDELFHHLEGPSGGDWAKALARDGSGQRTWNVYSERERNLLTAHLAHPDGGMLRQDEYVWHDELKGGLP